MVYAIGNTQAVKNWIRFKKIDVIIIKDLSVITKEDVLYAIGREGIFNREAFYEARRLKSQGYNISFEL